MTHDEAAALHTVESFLGASAISAVSPIHDTAAT